MPLNAVAACEESCWNDENDNRQDQDSIRPSSCQRRWTDNLLSHPWGASEDYDETHDQDNVQALHRNGPATQAHLARNDSAVATLARLHV